LYESAGGWCWLVGMQTSHSLYISQHSHPRRAGEARRPCVVAVCLDDCRCWAACRNMMLDSRTGVSQTGVVPGRTGFATTCSTRPSCKQASYRPIGICRGKAHCLNDSPVQSVLRWLKCKNCEAAYEAQWRLGLNTGVQHCRLCDSKAATRSPVQPLERVVLFVVHGTVLHA
jgi:hypothetical protein